jgi:DNA-binding response OmpR family regulator
LSDVSSKRVLVADADEIILAIVRHILTTRGYSVDVVTSAGSLDERLRANSYTAILVDLNLSGEEWLRSLPPESSDRVIALVSSGDGDSLPVKATIRKPLELDALADVVRAAAQNTGSSNDAA